MNSFIEKVWSRPKGVINASYKVINDFETSSEKECSKMDKENEKIYSRLLTQAEKAHYAIRNSGLSMNLEVPIPPKPSNRDRFLIWKKRNVSKKVIEQTEAVLFLESKGYKYDEHYEAYQAIDLANELIFVEEGLELTRTLSNEECQQWMSNETHYEGDLWKFWDKPPIIRPGSDPRTFDKLSMDERRKIGEGMMEYTGEGEPDTLLWTPHNKCRNPGNRAAAPWCYTKNPNKRWEYCAKPQYSNILGKIILFLIFVFVGVIAFFTIKKLFFYEYPMRFVAKITGGTLATKDTFTAPGASQPPPK